MKDFDIEIFAGQKTPKSMFIEASAGTGKTYNVIQMARTIVDKNWANLDEILIVTYTEKAVGELKSRLFEEFSDTGEVYTLHSFCQKMLRTFPFESSCGADAEMVGPEALGSFIEKLIRDQFCTDFEFIKFFERDGDGFIRDFSKVLQNGCTKYNPSIGFDNVYTSGQREFYEYCNSKIKIVYDLWQAEKIKRKIWTFDDILCYTEDAVCKSGGGNAFVNAIREKYKIAIVDEFQDTNPEQWNIFKTIFMKKNSDGRSDIHSLIVVGDPKQSIYAFQGADVNVYSRATSEIEKAGGEGYSLSTNFRSTEKMIEACGALFLSNVDGKPFFNPFSDGGNAIQFYPSRYPSPEKRTKNPSLNKAEPTLDNKVHKPVLIIEHCDSSASFAKTAVAKIIEFTRVENGRTRLQVFDKKKGLRSVSYKDFAVLYRKGAESASIEKCLREKKIPYVKSKDNALFVNREIDMWIALLCAIDAPDFANYNRKVLNTCLVTEFFGKSFLDLDAGPNAPLTQIISDKELSMFDLWRNLAQRRQWSALFESIMALTNIEEKLKDNVQSLGKIRQLATYVTDYLYKNNCSLKDAISYLRNVRDNNQSIGQDEGLIERANDRDAVKLMTIHASKGLQFPVVISIAGCENGYIGTSSAFGGEHDNLIYKYYDTTEQTNKLTYDKAKYEKEQKEELRRLLYVDFTRPESILILPVFELTSRGGATERQGWEGIGGFIRDFAAKNTDLCEITGVIDDLSFDNLEPSDNQNKTDIAYTYSSDLCSTLADKLPLFSVFQNSYSSVSHKYKEEQCNKTFVLSKDVKGRTFPLLNQKDYDCHPIDYKLFPTGAEIGLAVHEIFELMDFESVRDKKAVVSFEDFEKNKDVRAIVENALAKYGFMRESQGGEDICAMCISILYNTLNAKFPVLVQSAGSFELNSIAKSAKEAEVQFDQYSPRSITGEQNFWTGSIDLVFKRTLEGGREAWGIVDWKTDTFEELLDYADIDKLKVHCDEHYSVQRVLYSYTLIKYLSELFGKSPKYVFDNMFLGIYYVFVKGCVSGFSSGIYPHSWNSFEELETAYNQLLA